MRFVCMLAMGSGDVVWERRAAAAAADDSAVVEGGLFRKAALAAIVADELMGAMCCGCSGVSTTLEHNKTIQD
jgi:hypothetical protein